MYTHFASAERTNTEQLRSKVDIISNSPIVDVLLQTVGGLLAILDENRQIVSVNLLLMEALGIDEPAEVLGLRPGEALKCIHSHEEQYGCGTSKYCPTCGIAIAIVNSLVENKSVERKCPLRIEQNGNTIDVTFQIRSYPIDIDQRKFVVFFLQDITQQERRAALEKTFFHDMNNILNTLFCTTELLTIREFDPELIDVIKHSSLRLHQEFEIQRCLISDNIESFQLYFQKVKIEQVYNELSSLFSCHKLAKEKDLVFVRNNTNLSITTDLSLLLRVLSNMVTNALEASNINDVVKVWHTYEDDQTSFFVHNCQVIPENICRRIFQRDYSTKAEAGRGLGTFSMKLLGEQILGGEVGFISNEHNGTIFHISIPNKQ